MAEQFFPYASDKRFWAIIKALGVDSEDGVTIGTDGNLRATFGRFKVVTPLTNIDHTKVSGPHRWYTAVGLRLSFADDGLTFGTTNERGLCIEFVNKIHRVVGLKDHSALWVSVDDPEGLAAALDALPTE